MKAICVDDEKLITDYLVSMCRSMPPLTEAEGFTRGRDALAWLQENPADLALLDINMPRLDGITLAARIKEMHPQTAILFLTAYKEYAFDAYAVRPAGYLLKPVPLEKLAAEVRYLCGERHPSAPEHIRIKTFGNFDVYVDGKPIGFKLAKSKEILAYLVDRQGAGVSRAELFAAVWEDRPYDRKQQKQLDLYIRSLRETLQAYGISAILEMEKGILRVRPDTFVCDAYLFYSGDSDTINAYRGEYMSAYPWASMTEGILFWNATNKN